MKKIIFIAASLLFSGVWCIGQSIITDTLSTPMPSRDSIRIYAVKPAVEIPLAVAGAAFTAYNFAGISKKDASSQTLVESLSKKNINWFDRWGVHPYSESIDNASYIPFYVSMPLPLVVFTLGKKNAERFFSTGFSLCRSTNSYGYVIWFCGQFYQPPAPLSV